jgi:hypothetical protein
LLAFDLALVIACNRLLRDRNFDQRIHAEKYHEHFYLEFHLYRRQHKHWYEWKLWGDMKAQRVVQRSSIDSETANDEVF